MSFVRKRRFAKKPRKRTTTTYHRRRNYRPYAKLYRSIRAVSRKVAGEVFKFESTPNSYQYYEIDYSGTPPNNIHFTIQKPLLNISSGIPWVMPLNWYYTTDTTTTSLAQAYINGTLWDSEGPDNASIKNPLYRNTEQGEEEFQDSGAQLQYRLKYIYINALFNASISESSENSDGALRIVILCDKQPTGGTCTWYDENFTTNSRGVFNAKRINAQLNPKSLGRFSIMYDKTLRFNRINGYKPFKYFKRLSTIVRNNRGLVNPKTWYLNSSLSRYQTKEESAPIQKNAYYILMFSDGLNFTYSTDSSTPAAGFNLFNRIAYYNN